MKQFTLKLDKYYQRPIIELKDWHNFEALLDTGAFFPIWTANENILKKAGANWYRQVSDLKALEEKLLEICIN